MALQELGVAAGLPTDAMNYGQTTKLFARSGGPAVFSIGDSISTNGVLQGTNTPNIISGMALFGPSSWVGKALVKTGGKFRFEGTAATFGYTTAQILTTHLPTAVASNADVVFVLGGTNDNGGSITTTIANLTAIYTAIYKAGKLPILCTIPPQTSNNTGAGLTFITQLNLFIRRYAADNRFPLVDFHGSLTNFVDNTYITGYSSDGVHPTSIATDVMGNLAAAALNSIPVTSTPSPLASAYNPNLILPDVALSSAGTDKWTSAGGFAGAYFGGGISNAYKGNNLYVSRGSGDNTFIGPTTTAKWVAGNRVRLAFALDFPNTFVTGGTWLAALYDNTSAGTVLGFQGMDHPMTNNSVLVYDGVINTLYPNVVTSATAPFRQGHVGLSITSSNSAFAKVIPDGTTILSVSPDGTQALLSSSATTAGTALCVYAQSTYLTSAWEFTVPAAIVGHTLDFRFSVQTAAGVAGAVAQVSIADLTALGAL